MREVHKHAQTLLFYEIFSIGQCLTIIRPNDNLHIPWSQTV